MKKFFLGIVLILAATWLLYGRVADFEFLHLDDHDYTFRCLFVYDGLSWANVVEAFTNARHAAIWMPITYISYMIDISLFGAGAGGHHVVNVAVHALNAALFLALLVAVSRRLCAASNVSSSPSSSLPSLPSSMSSPVSDGIVFAAFVAAAFWALHPQRVEAVAWIASRKELLCAFFMLLGLLCWLRGGAVRIVGGIVCCALACMSKPTGMCFPFLALAMDLIFFGKFTSNSAHLSHEIATSPGTVRRSPRNDGVEGATNNQLTAYAVMMMISVGTGALAIYSQTHPEGMSELALFSASFPWRVLNAAVAVGLYIYHMIVPTGIYLDYGATPERFPIDGCIGLGALCVTLAAVGLLAWRVRSSRRVIGALALFFAASLAPTLGIFGSFGEHARADRFFYIPSMAFSFAISLAVVKVGIAGKLFFLTNNQLANKPINQLAKIVLVILPMAYAAAAWPVVGSYENDYTAFMRTLKFEPENGRALAHVANEECARFRRIDKGIDLYRHSHAVRPRDNTAAQLAYALALRGFERDHGEIRRLCAKFACDHSLDRKGMALEALGATAMRQRKWKEAISCLEDSIKAPARFYSDVDARLRLGACYANVRRTDDAIRIFEPLTQSPRTDVAARAAQFLETVKRNPNAVIFF